jgi:uncharacterized protein
MGMTDFGLRAYSSPMVIILLVIGTVFSFHLVWWFWADRRARRLPQPWLWRGLVTLHGGALAGYMMWMFVQPDAARAAHHYLPAWVLAWIYLWYIVLAPLTVLVLAVTGLVRLARLLIRGRKPQPPVEDPQEHPATDGFTAASAPAEGWTRRQVLGAAIVAAPIVLTGGMVARGMYQARHFRIRRVDLALPELPPALDGLSIAHLTDSHVGRYTRGPILREIAEATNSLRPDLILQTGDLIDLSLQDLPPAMDMLKRMQSRYGLYMCEGNHDLIDDGYQFRYEMHRAGIPLLLNDSQTIHVRGVPVQLMGVNWGRREPTRAEHMKYVAVQREPEAFSILMAHHPHVFDDAAAAGIPLTLAGHTHGGQIVVRGEVAAARALFRYVSGHYRLLNSSMIISNGVGNWMPLRINAPAEIIHLVLHRPEHEDAEATARFSI